MTRMPNHSGKATLFWGVLRGWSSRWRGTSGAQLNNSSRCSIGTMYTAISVNNLSLCHTSWSPVPQENCLIISHSLITLSPSTPFQRFCSSSISHDRIKHHTSSFKDVPSLLSRIRMVRTLRARARILWCPSRPSGPRYFQDMLWTRIRFVQPVSIQSFPLNVPKFWSQSVDSVINSSPDSSIEWTATPISSNLTIISQSSMPWAKILSGSHTSFSTWEMIS